MNPTTTTEGVDVGTLIAIMAATFALTTTVIGVLVRQLLKSYKNESEQRLQNLRTEYQERFVSVQKEVRDVATDRKECEGRETKAMDKLEATVDRYVDKWLEFQQAASVMEISRGKKVDALFNQVDHWKEEVRLIKPALFQKLDELHKRSAEELKRELKEYLRTLAEE